MSKATRQGFFALTFFMAALAAAAQVPVQGQSVFAWRMTFVKVGGGGLESIPFSRPFKLADGERFKLTVQADESVYAYVIYAEPSGKLTVLFQGPLKAGRPLSLPSEQDSFKVEPPSGTERIFVMVCAERLPNFEKALSGLEKGNPGARSSAILDEIARMKQSLSGLAEAPEKPVPMGGVTRGATQLLATEFRGGSTYVKTIRFDH